MMRRRPLFIAVIFAAALVGVGIGVVFLFASTQDGWNGENLHPAAKAWSEKDVVGAWQYRENDGAAKATITITFNPDGTFDQLIKPDDGSRPLTQRGSWAIWSRATTQPSDRGFAEARLNVYGALMHDDSGWHAHDWDRWLIIDSHQRAGGLAISGGAFPDPDCYQEFRQLP
jgi:hypothetical protein